MAEEPTVVAVDAAAPAPPTTDDEKKKRPPIKRDETPIEELFDLTKPIPRVRDDSKEPVPLK